MSNHVIFISCFFLLVTCQNFGYGPDPVQQYSGYVTIPGFRNDNQTHLFYWFFEARHNPETAPFVMWLTGGPGCSSLTALFFENGPYTINDHLGLEMNPNSWNEVANVIWVDQPVGSGFSYADSYSDYVTNEDEVAEDMYQFLQGFLDQYPKYRKLDFFVTGESYAGHYVPAISARIVKGNAAGGNRINLKGAAIGNGWVDPYLQYDSYAELLHMKGLLDVATTTVYNDTLLPVCHALISSGVWPAAFYECSIAMEFAFASAEAENFRTINVYDVRKRCEVEPLCYNFTNGDAFLNKASVKKAIGAKEDITWEACNMIVHTEMIGDWIGNYADDVPILLENGVDVLVYSGTEDFVCNYLGGQNWVNNLAWNGQSKFVETPLTEWKVNDQVAGLGKSHAGFTFLEVFNAGHMVPMDQPENALDMLTRFITGKPF